MNRRQLERIAMREMDARWEADCLKRARAALEQAKALVEAERRCMRYFAGNLDDTIAVVDDEMSNIDGAIAKAEAEEF